MQSKQQNKQPLSLSNKKTIKREFSFLKCFCPCIYKDKNIQKQSGYKKNEISTQKDHTLYQQTQSNLPVGKKQFNQDILIMIEQQTNYQKTSKNTQIKFNIKRNKNYQNFINNKKTTIANESQNQPHYASQSKQQIYIHVQQNIERQNRKYIQNSNNQQFYNVRNSQQQNKAYQQKRVYQQKIVYQQKRIIQQVNKLNKQVNKLNKQVNKLDKQANKSQKQQRMSYQSQDYQFLNQFNIQYQSKLAINKLKQEKLLLLGSNSCHLLTKISSVYLEPSSCSIQHFKQSQKSKKHNKSKLINKCQYKQLDKYWDKRYFLFQKFDQGIMLDQESWYSVTPQVVADYISTKVAANLVLDAFCGAGGDTIKLATTCKNVISNDIDPVKINCLINNARIYDVTNIQPTCSNFFDLNCKVDAVYLAPPWGGPDYYKLQSISAEQFSPPLSKIIQKSFSLSKNLYFLLPVNTQIQQLVSIICKKARQSELKSSTCFLKIQKIYFSKRLKFIFGYFVNQQSLSEIKLSQELSFIYSLLQSDHNNNGIFKHKKLIRKIRQECGMINLLNYVFQCQNYQSKIKPIINNIHNNINKDNQSSIVEISPFWAVDLNIMQQFIFFIKEKNIISQYNLQIILQQQQKQYQYEVKTRQQRNKRQKMKKIQKITIKKQKQQMQKQQQKVNSGQCNNSQQIIVQKQQEQRQSKQRQSKQQQQISEIRISLNTISQSCQSLNYQQTIKTGSMISKFNPDQLHNLQVNQRMRTNSSASILDSIHPIKKLNDFDVSMQQSHMDNQKLNSQRDNFSAIFNRHSTPVMLTQRANKMKKNKNSHYQHTINQEILIAQLIQQDNQEDKQQKHSN